MNDNAELMEWVKRSTEDSGVPLKVEDPAVIGQVTQLIRAQQLEE
ncbi:hypothetical protein [Streptomyces sp. NPDC060002]